MENARLHFMESEVERLKSKMAHVGDWLMLEYPTNSRTYQKGVDLKAEAKERIES